MKYNFDKKTDRKNTNSIKYDVAKYVFKSEEILPMWVADMDFETPDFIINDLKNRLNHEILGYTMRGKSFNSSFVNWAKDRYNWAIQNNWLEFSPGVVTGIAVAIYALTNPNDKIIIQTPVYAPFFEVVTGNERILQENPLKKDESGKYLMDFEHLESIIDEKTKMIIISNPHNPVGRVWTKEELNKLAEIVIKHNLILVSDDIHADFIYPDFSYTAISSLSDEIAQRTITIMSPSKTFNIAGLSTSVVVIPNEKIKQKYTEKMSAMHLFLGNIFGGVAFESAYTNGKEWLTQLLVYLNDNIEFVVGFVNENMPKVKVVKPEGTFLMWLDFSETNLSHEEIKQKLINDAKLGFNSGVDFGKNGEFYFRMNIATQRENIIEALNRLKNVFGG